jgi:hypothetical protein
MKLNRLLATFAIALAVLITGCKKDDFVEIAGVCPIVVTTDPVNLATFVPLDKIITATFNVSMDPATFVPEAFTLQDAKKGSVAVNPGVLSYDIASKTMSFVPSSPLAVNTTYTATIKSTVKDLKGIGLQGNYVWTFSTGVLVVPTVISTVPLNLATAVPLNQTVTATFSQVMNSSTLTATSFTLANGGTPVLGAVSYSGTTASFNPTADLLPGVLYTATITTGAQNVAGTPMAANYVWTFTALNPVPTVILTDPLNLATAVVLNKTVTANFSEAMNGATLTGTTFTLANGGTPVVGVVSYAGTTASFNPTGNLLPGVLYTATITTGAQNVAGTSMAANYVWTFTTFSAVPTVILTSPLNLAGNVALNKTVTATFSTAMNNLTLTGTTFTLYNGATPVTGAVSYAGTTASFNPDVDLLPGVTYTATITTGAQSVSGTALASDYVWTFTTLAAGVPFVVSVDPLNLATNVPLNQVISANFSETMDLLTINTSTFTVMNGATPVLGTVNYAGTTATFTPDVDLILGVTYTATITTGAMNLSATPIATDYVWTFSTGATVPLGPGIVNLGTAGNFAVLTKAGISTTGVTSVIGDMGVSPAAASAITGFGLIMDASNEFSQTPIVTGRVYASDYAAPTPAYITTAISDMETALTTGMGMTLSVITELGAGDISGMTLVPGLYKWGTGLLITGVGVTLSGGPDDTWVFQISDDFTVNGDVVLSGGAQAKNIFWITSTQALLNTGVDFSGNIIAQTLISLSTGAKVNGRLLSQTAVTLDAATVVKP